MKKLRSHLYTVILVCTTLSSANAQVHLAKGKSVVCTASISEVKGNISYNYDAGALRDSSGPYSSPGKATVIFSRNQDGVLTLNATFLSEGEGDFSFGTSVTNNGRQEGVVTGDRQQFTIGKILFKANNATTQTDASSRVSSHLLGNLVGGEYNLSTDNVTLSIPVSVYSGKTSNKGRISIRWSRFDNHLSKKHGSFTASHLSCALK